MRRRPARWSDGELSGREDCAVRELEHWRRLTRRRLHLKEVKVGLMHQERTGVTEKKGGVKTKAQPRTPVVNIYKE